MSQIFAKHSLEHQNFFGHNVKTEKITIAVRQVRSRLWELSDKKPNNMASPSESMV